MVDYRRSSRFVVCVAAVALLGAGQPPSAVPPSAPPPSAPQPQPGPGPSAPLVLPVETAPVPPGSFQRAMPPARQFDLKFDTKASAKELLPVAPKVAPIAGPVLTDDLKKIPEITFQAPPKDKDPTNEAARQIAKINHVNANKTDAFMAALLENRPDLAGVPFAMGDDCRTNGDRLKYFTQAAQTVRQAMGGIQQPLSQPARANVVTPPPAPPVVAAPSGSQPATGSVTLGNFTAVQSGDQFPVTFFAPPQPFWKSYTTLCEQEDANRERTDKEQVEHVTLARIAALTQMLAAESAEMRLGLVKYLTGVPHVEATKALARMAIF